MPGVFHFVSFVRMVWICCVTECPQDARLEYCSIQSVSFIPGRLDVLLNEQARYRTRCRGTGIASCHQVP